jgi:Family of unknown function (DUF6334)
MRRDVALALAQSLSPTLAIFDVIAGQPLRSVWQVEEHGCLDRIILEFGKHSLVVTVAPDDDTVDLDVIDATGSSKPVGTEVSQTSPWRNFVGVAFGWGWIAVNQQGYCDTALLSFGGVAPQIMLNVVASSIKVAAIG